MGLSVSSAIREFCTSEVHRWNSINTQFYSGLAIASNPSGFKASLTNFELGNCRINRITSSASLVERTRRENLRESERTILFLLLSRGDVVSRQFGREHSLRPGHAMLCDPAAPYGLDCKTPHEMFTVELSTSSAVARRPDLDIRTSGGALADPRYSQLLLSFLKGVWQQVDGLGADADWQESVSRIGFDLATCAMRGDDTCRPPRSQLGLRKAVIEYVMGNIEDPELRTSKIADALGISPRTVQSAFEGMLTTASGFILERRLQNAAARLRDRARDTSITSIAFDCGFSDGAYFSRCFRRRFGVAPREYV